MSCASPTGRVTTAASAEEALRPSFRHVCASRHGLSASASSRKRARRHGGSLTPDTEALDAVADRFSWFEGELRTHSEVEDGIMLRTIIRSIPPDPRLQPWVAGALTPEHREARLRNMEASLAPEVLAGVMTQIHGGVATAVWTDIETRMPELAALAEPGP